MDSIYKNDGDNNEPKEVNKLFLRMDDIIETPLQLNVDPNELYVIINNEYQVNFADEIGEDAFFNDLFFFIEEMHHVPDKSRTTTRNKIINLEDELKTLGKEMNDEKLNDR